ncbi:MAG: hypothetical protein LUG89_02200 [Methanosphaera sp.]|nr:hypothetical protein [Methanosphaera sp.]
MDALTIIIMLILFVFAMVFVFSTALLTPYMGKKNLLSVVGLGLVIGLVGGLFLLSPIVDDLPDFSRTIIEGTVDGTDTVEMSLSTNGNLTEIIANISSINGVHSVTYDGIMFKTDEFESTTLESTFLNKLNSSNSYISSVEDMGNNTYKAVLTDDADPQSVLNSIYSTFSTENYGVLRYTSMTATATVDANNVTNIMDTISNSGAIVTEVTGPTEDAVSFINTYVPDSNVVVLIGGAIGVIVALIGQFVDSIYSFSKRSHRRKKKESSRDRIMRKTIPDVNSNRNSNHNTRRRSFNKEVSRNDSIDIFNESFDESPKQNIGSNKNFKQLEEDDLKTSSTQEKSESRFSRLRNRRSNDDSTNKKVETDTTSNQEKTSSKPEENNNKPEKSSDVQPQKRSTVKVRPKKRD